MISNYNLSCDYHNFELKDKIYLIPDYALKVIYTDGFNEVVFSGNSANVTILEGYDISFQEESSFDERFRFSKTLSLKVNGYKTFNDLDYRYMAIIETKDSEFFIVNVDFPSYVTHTYTLNNGTNNTELVFSSQSNIATLKLTNFNPNNVNSCKQYSNAKIKDVKLTEAWASYLSTWQKSLVNKGDFVDIEPLPDSVSLTEEFDGEKYTVTLGFDIPMSYYKNDWHIKLLQFEENKYRGYIQLEDGNVAFVGYNGGLFPSYTINGDIISIRLTETAIRGIAYGNDYVLIDTDIPNTIEYNGTSCYTYNWLSTCDWHVEDKPDYITISPSSGLADTQYELTICHTDDETGYEVSEFIIKSCNANARANVIINNPIYRWVQTEETMCIAEPIERTVSGDPYCNNCDKYIDVFNEISYDDGETWQVTSSSSTLIETDSEYCKEYRTIQSGESYCYEGDECVTTVTQIRCGGGEWQYYSSAVTVIDDDSDMCTYYLTFRPLEACTFGFSKTGVYYSINHGTWTVLPSGNTISAADGDEIRWRGSMPSGTQSTKGTFTSSGRFNAEGYVSSMCYGKNHLNREDTYPLGHSYLFKSLFAYNTGLTDASDIILSINLGNYANGAQHCYEKMFKGCTSLTKAPVLSATTLPQACYQEMFADCTSLTNMPELPATTLGGGDYTAMFSGCTSLTATTILPANTLSYQCYKNMFKDCTSLVNPPEILGTKMANNCYEHMFAGCTSLVEAPNLVNSSLAKNCYSGMFIGCTSLIKAPILRNMSASLPRTYYSSSQSYDYEFSGCYSGMFSGCTSLSSVTFMGNIALCNSRYTSGFLNNTASSGVLYYSPYISESISRYMTLPSGWHFSMLNKVDAYKNEYFSYTNSYDGKWIEYIPTGNNKLEYSYDLHNWYELTGDNAKILASGQTIYLKGETTPTSDGIGQLGFMGNNPTEAYYNGNIMSLIYGDDFVGKTDLTDYEYAFKGLFKLATGTAKNHNNRIILPATKLSRSCYESLFNGLPTNQIICLATDISATDCTKNWASSNISSSGTFIKNASMNDWSTGVNGIPSGWTVVDYTG